LQTRFEFPAARALQPGAVTAQGNKAIDDQAMGKDLVQA